MSIALEVTTTDGDCLVNDGIGISYRVELCGALRDAMPIMELLKELKRNGYPITTAKAKVHCKVFEDNSGALEMARTHKYRPRTKHLKIRLHHFRDYVERGDISIHAIGTNGQPADYLTKALKEETLRNTARSPWVGEPLTTGITSSREGVL